MFKELKAIACKVAMRCYDVCNDWLDELPDQDAPQAVPIQPPQPEVPHDKISRKDTPTAGWRLHIILAL